ncbi:DUF6461 domain-containing protein [Catenuloplanes sp. NPDC051500]|uniref:DUF6461 domain-containing protein n=1 Tax=Catenuloplanes sp. NPDC051500 TaxID=3363959 RepID=UPI003788075E
MDEITEAEAARIARGIPLLAARIADGPAARLGRLGAPDAQRPDPARQPHLPAGPWAAGATRPIGQALGTLGRDIDRLLGALELAVPQLDGPDLSAHVTARTATRYFAIGGEGHNSEALTAATTMIALYPGLDDLVVALTRRLADRLADALPTIPDGADEQALAARHGAGYVALAVCVADALLPDTPAGLNVTRPVAVVGLGLGAAAVLLREAPMPDAYPAALLARIRAEYLLPRYDHGYARATGHRFALAEGDRLPDGGDFRETGLVAAVDGGAVIRTGIEGGPVNVTVSVRADPPGTPEDGWDEIAEVSWHAAEGRASVLPIDHPRHGALIRVTPPWPGDYRLRVHARGRDREDGGTESYSLEVWAAPPAPALVHRSTDRLGARLRGEPEPSVPPEWAYRWIHASRLQVAATVTVVVGLTAQEVLRVFGADPGDPRPYPHDNTDSALLSVLETPEAVLVVEDNNYRGSHHEVLTALSVNGLAGSMFWNVNALARLSLAEDGRELVSFEPSPDVEIPKEVADVLDGITFTGGGTIEKCLVAVERFTGRGITRTDLAAIEEAGVAYAAPEPPQSSADHATRDAAETGDR